MRRREFIAGIAAATWPTMGRAQQSSPTVVGLLVGFASRFARLARPIAAGAVIGLLFAAQPCSAQFLQQGSKLTGSNPVGSALVGNSVALSANGNTLVVGSPYDTPNTGAALVFTRSLGTWSQQGSKLVGSNASQALQGWSVALSADGSTLAVGGPSDSSSIGAVWIYILSAGVWTQQGAKLVGNNAIGNASQGWAVALSANGNTLLVGGREDNAGVGAAWVFTRSGTVWSQQAKLIGTGVSGATSLQGSAVALSGDGNTAIVGGPADNSSTGAAWIFARSGSTWSPQGGKLTSNTASAAANQGFSVALSGDGNTAMVGGYGDSNGVGAAWVYTRSGTTWAQQGSKLIGSGGLGTTHEGASVALSNNGNVATIGGYGDNNSIGAAWAFTRSNGTWSQQGSKFAGSGNTGQSDQGQSVALSANGNTVALGGPGDNGSVGAVWPFVRTLPTNTHDFNGDGDSDILWRNTSTNNVALWLMSSNSVVGSAALATVPNTLSIVGQHDFNGDGDADLLWRDANGTISMWLMNGTAVSQAAVVGPVPNTFTLAGTADLNNDGNGDLLWFDTNTGTVSVWFMNGTTVSGTAAIGSASPSTWSIVGDTNGYIFWRDTSGDIALWGLQNGQVVTSNGLGNVTSNFVVQGLGDFNGDGFPDILWRDTNSGTISIWFTNGQQVISAGVVSSLPSNWNIVQVGDYNGDGMSDLLLMDTSGDVAMWLMNGTTVSQSLAVTNVGSGSGWTVQSVNDN